MPEIYKIGLTIRTPETRLADANAVDTWRPPLPYYILRSKWVNNICGVEKAIHRLLESLGARVHPKREFFRISKDNIDNLFTILGAEDTDSTADESETEKEEKIITYECDETKQNTFRGHAKISCICCTWVGRASLFPCHAIKHHSKSLFLDKEQFEHCVNLHLVKDSETISFTGCLTCYRGTTTSPYCGNGARWTTNHSSSTTCKDQQALKIKELELSYLSLVSTPIPVVEIIELKEESVILPDTEKLTPLTPETEIPISIQTAVKAELENQKRLRLAKLVGDPVEHAKRQLEKYYANRDAINAKRRAAYKARKEAALVL
jgi:hypothetical protein